nr:type IV pilus biogenesis protein PilP [Aquabacterium terrae]
MLAHGAVSAAPPAADELARIESETAVLKARARKVDVQAQIAGRQAEIATREAETKRAVNGTTGERPVLYAVEGIGSVLFATLELSNQKMIDVRAGDMLADGSRVVSIRPNEVVLETARKDRIRLTGTGRAGAEFAPLPSAMPAMPGLPAVPPLPALRP